LVPLVLAACAAVDRSRHSEAPSTTPTLIPTPTPSPTATPLPTFPDIPPLPADLLIPDRGVAVSATSPAGTTVGERFRLTLGHCGLYSPVDIDGSLWEPLWGQDARGGPIDTDREVGPLVNATEGEAMLVNPIRLDYRTPDGIVVVFRRIDGPRVYPGCF
jgi:hypothetical protein